MIFIEQTYGNVLCRAIGVEEPIEIDVSAFRHRKSMTVSYSVVMVLAPTLMIKELEKVILTHDSESCCRSINLWLS